MTYPFSLTQWTRPFELKVNIRIPFFKWHLQKEFKLAVFLDEQFKDALERWQPKKAKRWLFLGANPHGESYPGIPFICRASRLGSIQILGFLLSHGADPNILSGSRWRPLHFAALKDHGNIIKMLIEHGADVDDVASPGWTPLTIAANNNRYEAVDMLCQMGANPNCLDEKERTPLLICANHGFEEATKALLTYKADYTLRDKRGFSPLHLAAGRGYVTVCQLLLDAGANPLMSGPWNKTPLDSAKAEGFSATYALLEKAALSQSEELAELFSKPLPPRKSQRI